MEEINDNFGWIWAALLFSIHFLSLLSGDVDTKLSEWSCSSPPPPYLRTFWVFLRLFKNIWIYFFIWRIDFWCVRNVGFIVEDGVNVLQKSGILAFVDWEVRNKSNDLIEANGWRKCRRLILIFFFLFSSQRNAIGKSVSATFLGTKTL